MTLSLQDFRNARSLGIGDQQRDGELRAQRRLAAAIAELRLAIEDVNAISVVVEIEPSALDDFVNDELPAPGYWDEKLALARHG
jgi:hypothetical protein